MNPTAEHIRLQEQYSGQKNWLHWGPYLSERQWGTVREDYSPGGTAWDYFPHDHARSRVYRWGEDGIAGISDEKQRLCFALALWNGRDSILKERLFGLAGPEGNHGEDVKELYYYLDNTPSHAYMKQLYKYPQAAYPYAELVHENARRGREEPEYELLDSGLFDDNRYWDVFTEYAKADTDDLLIQITAHNRGADAAELWLLPTLWFRNLWNFGLIKEKPVIKAAGQGKAALWHESLGDYNFYFENPDRLLFTENEDNREQLWGQPNDTPFVKDAFHRAVTQNNFDWLADKTEGTKCAPLYQRTVPAGGSVTIKLRLSKKAIKTPFGKSFDRTFNQRLEEADTFYANLNGTIRSDAQLQTSNSKLQTLSRQALAGMLWSKQYFNIDMPRWLDGDPGQPAPPESRKTGRNSHWRTLNNEDIISMPDKWEYPWYAAWDLAFHCVALAEVDAQFAKNQLVLLLREWYMHPNGQLPAYEWAFGDVNPPVHAWACLQVFKQEGSTDIDFLKRVFQKLLLNFTWWVNRKDHKGNNVFEGGFLGLDNIGVFDRSNQIPGGGYLEQADGTAWMGMYCLNMLEMALIIAQHDLTFEDVATKFFEHFIYIAESLNRIGHDWTGAWDEQEGFFYDILALPNGTYIPMKVRSLVGLSTMFAVSVLPKNLLDKLPDFTRRLRWFQQYRVDKGEYLVLDESPVNGDLLLSLVPKTRLQRLLHAMLDEREFLSPGGIRALSKIHENGYAVTIDGQEFGLRYEPGESSTGLFGGNSNWRGPVWMPMNYLLIQALREYSRFFGNDCQVEFPTGSGRQMSLGEVADALSARLVSLFLPGTDGRRPIHGNAHIYADNPHFQDLILFYEYFHGDTGRGVGASHQTGWTGVVASLAKQFSKV